ncbi:VWA domain-containing protein [Rubripirellula sp.]|nr:VWA domain-containing protein [Rubripirellula sp.]MDA9840554.1 VWA domain-containing protein [Rubripirellula sp.]
MFQHPWFLSLLIVVPWLVWRLTRGDRQHAVSYSSVLEEVVLPVTYRQRFRWVPDFLLILTFMLMVIAMARPRVGREQTVVNTEGIAIELVVDRSGSMMALDFQIDGNHVDRLEALKNVASKFLLGEQDDSDAGSLSGRSSDLVGLVVFAGYADAVTPLTLDHSYLVSQLNQVRIVNERSEDGTAIGDAISLAVEKLSTLDDRTDEQKIKSKIMILLTDGENTAGEVDPVQAAELAAAMGIKIYTVGMGTKGRAPFPVRRTADGQVLVQYQMVNIDEETLREIADKTEGQYFRATDSDSLKEIYEAIDQLEKTKIEAESFFDYKELALQSHRYGGYSLPALLLLAFSCLIGRVVLMQTIFRQIVD